MGSPADSFASTIRCEQPVPGTQVPLWELEFHGWELFSGRPLCLGNEFESLGAADKERALHRNAEIIAEVSRLLSFSAVTVPGGYWEIAPGHPAYYWLPEEHRERQIKLLVQSMGQEIMLVAGAQAVLAMPGALEYMDFAQALMERPREIGERAKGLLRQGLEQSSRLLDLGIGALYTPSDMADNHGPYFDPGQMEQLILPCLDRWAVHVRQQGGLAILHSDGDLGPVLDAIADTGVQALQSIDPTAGMDLAETLTKVEGRLCLCGNIQCGLFISGTPETVFESTRQALSATRKKRGLVLGASNAIERGMKKENYLAFLGAWKQFGSRVP